MASVRREKFKPLGGPDGGNGGRGGNVELYVDPQATTLLDYHHSPHRKATNGQPGGGDDRNGADGGDLVLPVPAGTVVKGTDGEVIADLVNLGETFVVARGGRGGLGNRALSSQRRKAPGFALLGEPGDALDVVLELKSLADVALIGYPSAGKSSLVSVLSAARPKIADYPFTTLVPNLGVVTAGEQRFTVADVPGLIPGASEGKGLGLEFLRHVERCSVLVHVIDCATLEPDRDPLSDLDVIEAELSQYVPDDTLGGRPISERTRMIVLNKADVPEARELAEMVKPDLEARGLEVFIVSAVARTGLRELTFAMARHVTEARAAVEAAVPARIVLRPKAVDDSGFVVKRENTPDGEVVPRRRRASHALGPPDRLLQRRGGRLPRRPAGAGRGRDRAVQGRRGRRRDRRHRQRRQLRRLRLGAHDVRRRRAPHRPPRLGRAAGQPAPPDPRGEARGLRRPPGLPDGRAPGPRGRAPRRPLGRRGRVRRAGR